MHSSPHYKRVLIKLSGESLIREGDDHTGVDPKACLQIAQSIQAIHELNVEVGIVLGAGNLFRGRTLTQEMKIPKVKADEIGMLGTLMNGIILAQTLQNLGCKSTLLSCIPVGEFIQTYSQEKAKRALQQGEIVIFVGGTGHPFFTTDTAASLRALEIEAEVLLKATKVDGVYSADPKKVASAKRYEEITFTEALEKNLQVMDATAISLCRENNLPIVVFDMYQKNNLLKVIQKKNCGTLVHGN